MRKRRFLEFLMVHHLSEEGQLPYWENFKTYFDGNVERYDLYSYLDFLYFQQNDYVLSKKFGGALDSFQEYLNRYYPPAEEVCESEEEYEDD